MKNADRTASEPRRRKERRRPEHEAERRFTNAWREIEAVRTEDSEKISPWGKLRRFSRTPRGRLVLIAPLGAIGAYLLLRKKR